MNASKIGLMLLLASILASCGSKDCGIDLTQTPVLLLNGARSYAPLEQYANFRTDPTYRQIEGNGQSGPDELSVERFEVRRSFLGHTGKLEYVFYFGRLAQTRFHPDNPQIFFLAAKAKGFPAEVGSEIATGDAVLWATGRRASPETLGASDSRITRSFLACVEAND